MDIPELFAALFVGGIIFAVVFVVLLILRELVCWYFKINERIKQADATNAKLDAILAFLEEQAEDSEPPASPSFGSGLAPSSLPPTRRPFS